LNYPQVRILFQYYQRIDKFRHITGIQLQAGRYTINKKIRENMKQVVQVLHILIVILIVAPVFNSAVSGQNVEPSPRLVICGGGKLPDTIYNEFRSLAGPETKLVVIPTASKEDINVEEIQQLWQSRGFREVYILHTNDPEVASTDKFFESLKTATAVWFSGGSQQRIADAYVGTPVEEELYKLLQRGGVIGGTSAGAAIQSRVMIRGGKTEPKISTGLDLLPGAIIDQHFLKRNRIARLIAAVRIHPDLFGFGIDEGTAIVVSDGTNRIIGTSYVLRVEVVDGAIQIDSFKEGDTLPPADHRVDDEIQKNHSRQY
jgi:cyanophycinase